MPRYSDAQLDHFDEFCHDMELRDQLAISDAVRPLLRKLPVSDLRILWRMYFKFDGSEISKGEIVDTLALEHGEDIMWKIFRK